MASDLHEYAEANGKFISRYEMDAETWVCSHDPETD
jgi:hypothetical protein